MFLITFKSLNNLDHGSIRFLRSADKSFLAVPKTNRSIEVIKSFRWITQTVEGVTPYHL